MSFENQDIGDRPEWILRILYTPAMGKTSVPIVGMTRMMKACFLLQKKLESEHGTMTDFQFHAGDYGPLDDMVYDSLEQLEESGMIVSTESSDYDGTEYRLTDEGAKEASELYNELSSSERNTLSWLKEKHILSPLSQLLSYVYNRYPKYAENSKYSDL